MRKYWSKVIRLLPTEVRSELDARIAEGALTTDELLAFVRSRQPGTALSRSSLGRYAKHRRQEIEKYRETRLLAEAWVGPRATERDGEIASLLNDTVRMVALHQLTGRDDKSLPPPPEQIVAIAETAERLANADKRMAESLKLQPKPKARRATEAAQGGGLSDEAADMIRRALFGDPDEFKDDSQRAKDGSED
ncbi:MAG: phage protein Gp27 family protein [Candidatus Binataceae bacterium]